MNHLQWKETAFKALLLNLRGSTVFCAVAAAVHSASVWDFRLPCRQVSRVVPNSPGVLHSRGRCLWHGVVKGSGQKGLELSVLVVTLVSPVSWSRGDGRWRLEDVGQRWCRRRLGGGV